MHMHIYNKSSNYIFVRLMMIYNYINIHGIYGYKVKEKFFVNAHKLWLAAILICISFSSLYYVVLR